MGNALDGLRIKSDRAYQHIKELEEAMRLFFNSDPYSVSLDYNAETGNMEWRLVEAKDIPLSISTIAGDAIQNLRSALDHLVWQLVILNGKTPTRITSFPIAESLQEYTSAKFRRKIEGVAQENISAIDALKPYQGGNAALWPLHSLNNIDKHRLLLPAVIAVLHHDLLPSQREHLTKIFFGSNPTATAA